MKFSPVANIVNSIINPDITNVLYYKHNSFFDLIIKTLDYNFIENNDFYDLWYNVCLSNDPIYFSQNHANQCNKLHINSLLFFHNKPPAQFKKEDNAILKRHILKSTKILCLPELVSQWLPSDSKWHIVDYGIPYIVPSDSQERETDILFINLNNNPNITAIFDSVKRSITSAQMLTNLPDSISDLYDILYKSKICLDFDNHINSLVAASCGCFCMTTYENNHLFYYQHINNFDLSTFANMVQDIIKNINQDHLLNQQKEIINKFPFDMFSKRISLLMQSITREKVLL